MNKIGDLWKNQPEQAKIKAQTLLNTKNDLTSADLAIYRAQHLAKITIDQIDLPSMIGDAINQEIAAVTKDNYITYIFQPRYSKVQIHSISTNGLEEYVAKQLQHHARHIFAGAGPNSLLGSFFHHYGNTGNILGRIFTDLTATLETTIQIPIIQSLTWCLKFKEQLHALKTSMTDKEDYPSLFILLTPYLRHPGFHFNVPSPLPGGG